MSEMEKAVRVAAATRNRTPMTEKQIQAAVAHMEGKRGVDILKLADAAGISVGAAKHLNEARKAHFATQGSSAPQTSAQRADAFLKQKWVRK